jgi:alginate O-acetyltransferase complex protein AlgJ
MMETRTPAVQTILAVLLILVLGTGFVSGVVVLAGSAQRSAAADDGPATNVCPARAKALLDGTRTSQLESEFEEQVLLRRPAITVFAALRYALFRSGNEGVVVGREGWLFTAEELEWHPSDDAELERRLAYVTRVVEWLRARGTSVVVALLPAKARIQSDALRGRWRSLADHPRYGMALDRLTARDVHAANLAPALDSVSEAFLARDTHWTPAGAAASARAVAEAAYRLSLDDVERAEFQTLTAGEITVAGDLMTFVPVGPFAKPLGLGPQTVQLTETRQTSASGLGLFDTPRIPVTLVGTSYSADERWNFVGELRAALGMDVLNVAEEGLGPFVPMAGYLQSEAFAEVPPALIVWEIPERYLTLPDVEVPAVR